MAAGGTLMAGDNVDGIVAFHVRPGTLSAHNDHKDP